MKKLLRLLIIISSATPLPTYAVACGQNSLKDATLKAIYQSNDTSFKIHDLVSAISPPETEVDSPFTITNDNLKTLAETAAQLMLKDQGITTAIPWYDDSTAKPNQKCYLFQITNGTETDTSRTWDVNKETQEININLNYQVGTVDNNKKFVASEQISKSINVECGVSQSDKNLQQWVTDFKKLTDTWTSGLTINSSDKKLELPSDGTVWDDLNDGWKKLVYQTLSTEIATNPWEASNSVTFKVVSSDKKTSGNKLEIKLEANQSKARCETDYFTIVFTKNSTK